MAPKQKNANVGLQQALDQLGVAAKAEAVRAAALPHRDPIYEGRLEYIQSFASSEKRVVERQQPR